MYENNFHTLLFLDFYFEILATTRQMVYARLYSYILKLKKLQEIYLSGSVIKLIFSTPEFLTFDITFITNP